jgi:AcrR family transcriptional regulator
MSTYLSTHDRILDGAMRAISKQGLARLAMRDVGAYAGVARGTVYRHFPNRESLLQELGRREAQRFMDRWRVTLAAAPHGEDRLFAAIEYPARFAREHPLLLRLVESDPDYVLRAIREYYPAIRGTVQQLLGALLSEHNLVRRGLFKADSLVDWTVRIMISVFLFPPEDSQAMIQSLAALHRVVDGDGGEA